MNVSINPYYSNQYNKSFSARTYGKYYKKTLILKMINEGASLKDIMNKINTNEIEIYLIAKKAGINGIIDSQVHNLFKNGHDADTIVGIYHLPIALVRKIIENYRPKIEVPADFLTDIKDDALRLSMYKLKMSKKDISKSVII